MIKVSERIYMSKPLFAPLGASVTLYVGEHFCILIDAGSSRSHVNKIKEEILEITQKPVKYVILTHHHYDHVYGCNDFTAQIILSKKTQDYLHLNEDNIIVVEQSYTLAIDDEIVEISYLPTSHCDDHLLVNFSHAHVICLGDGLQAFVRDGVFEFYAKQTMALIETLLHTQIKCATTGHQGVLDQQTLAQYLEKLTKCLTIYRSNQGKNDLIEQYVSTYVNAPSRLEKYFLNGFIAGDGR